MKKILAHICREKTYLPLVQGLGEKIDLVSGILHEVLFDAYHKCQPDVVILPMQEYTQEFHEFVDQFKNKTQIIIFLGSLNNKDITEYCQKQAVSTIEQNQSENNELSYKFLYDTNTFRALDLPKIDKILTILSNNNEYNHQMLDSILYPNSMLKLVLINNKEFAHQQNIGYAEPNDLSILMNHYDYVIDLTKEYYAELQACTTKTIKLDENNLKHNIENKVLVPKINDVEQYSIYNFINNQLLPFIHKENK